MDVLQETLLCLEYYKVWIAKGHVKIDGLQQIIPIIMVCSTTSRRCDDPRRSYLFAIVLVVTLSLVLVCIKRSGMISNLLFLGYLSTTTLRSCINHFVPAGILPGTLEQ
jgi:hypothetical protein